MYAPREADLFTRLQAFAPLPEYLADGKAHVLHIDFEGRCQLHLDVVGNDNWSQHAEALCLAYGVDDGEVLIWRPGDPVPACFIEAARNPLWLVVSFNAGFERSIFSHLLVPQCEFPGIPLAQWRCTQAMAGAMALPTKLEVLAGALDLLDRKDSAGHKVMMRMTKPRKAKKNEDPNGTYWHDTPELREQLERYCIQDVIVEREVWHRLHPLSDAEHNLWRVDRIINERGFLIDGSLLQAEQRILEAAEPAINAELAQATGGAVSTIDQVEKLRQWFSDQGLPLPDVQAKTIKKLLEVEGLPDPVRRVAELRQAGASVTKVAAFICHAGVDNRIRNTLKFCAAATRRWGGKHVQPQNFRKARISPEELELAAELIPTGDYERVRARFPNVISVIADLSRYMVMAGSGHVLYGGDFSGIEDRVGAWIGGETWKIEAYQKFDRTGDPNDEPYRLLAASLYGSPVSQVTEDQRKVAKTCQLAFQYGGGLRAFRRFEPSRFTRSGFV